MNGFVAVVVAVLGGVHSPSLRNSAAIQILLPKPPTLPPLLAKKANELRVD